MIRRKVPETRLFYASEELYRPNPSGFYARLNAVVKDWAKLAKPLEAAFSQERNGRPVDPVVYLKIFVVGYYENISMDTELAERIADSLSIRSFLGYGPCEATPDHSSISRVRESFAVNGNLEEVLASTVKICSDMGLVDGLVVAADTSLIPANAGLSSLKSLRTGLSVKEHLRQSMEGNAKPKVSNEEFRSTTDTDARLSSKPNFPRRLYYKSIHVTDGSSQVILSAGCARADEGDSHCTRDPVTRAANVLKKLEKPLGTVLGDAGFDDGDFHAHVEGLGARPLTNYIDHKREGQTPKSQFVYDESLDAYRCSAGKVLPLFKQEQGRKQYRASESDCAECPLRSGCLRSGKARWLTRTANEESRARNIALCHSDEGRRLLRTRGHIVEPPFGHMKQHGGLARISCRGINKADARIVIGAVAWNLKKAVSKLLNAFVRCLSTLIGDRPRLNACTLTFNWLFSPVYDSKGFHRTGF